MAAICGLVGFCRWQNQDTEIIVGAPRQQRAGQHGGWTPTIKIYCPITASIRFIRRRAARASARSAAKSRGSAESRNRKRIFRAADPERIDQEQTRYKEADAVSRLRNGRAAAREKYPLNPEWSELELCADAPSDAFAPQSRFQSSTRPEGRTNREKRSDSLATRAARIIRILCRISIKFFTGRKSARSRARSSSASVRSAAIMGWLYKRRGDNAVRQQ